jgi:hypothetical protein
MKQLHYILLYVYAASQVHSYERSSDPIKKEAYEINHMLQSTYVGDFCLKSFLWG